MAMIRSATGLTASPLKKKLALCFNPRRFGTFIWDQYDHVTGYLDRLDRVRKRFFFVFFVFVFLIRRVRIKLSQRAGQIVTAANRRAGHTP